MSIRRMFDEYSKTKRGSVVEYTEILNWIPWATAVKWLNGFLFLGHYYNYKSKILFMVGI